MNLAERARKAAKLTQTELSKLLGVKQQLLSRWEKGARMSAPAATLMRLIELEPEGIVHLLRAERGEKPGFAGDGGPPPKRRQSYAPAVDEWGNPTAVGEGEADLGWERGEELGAGEMVGFEDAAPDESDDGAGDFFKPSFPGEADFEPSEGQV